MSLDRSPESNRSSSQESFASYRWTRSGTVRKVKSIGSSSASFIREEASAKRSSMDDIEVTTKRILDNLNVDQGGDKLRKCLMDSPYRQSLESISEYKMKMSFTPKGASSFDSSSSDCADFAVKTTAPDLNANNKGTVLSESSSYLSWIESLNSDYLANASTTEAITADAKTGEWNNFWLNYNNVRNKYLQQNSFSCMSTDNTEDHSSAASVQKEAAEEAESAEDVFYITRTEILETIKCCQKIIDVLQIAMKRTDVKTDSKNDTNYSIPQRTVSK